MYEYYWYITDNLSGLALFDLIKLVKPNLFWVKDLIHRDNLMADLKRFYRTRGVIVPLSHMARGRGGIRCHDQCPHGEPLL